MENNVLYLLIEADKSPRCHRRIMEHLGNNPYLRWCSIAFPNNPIYKTEEACIELLTKLAERQESLAVVLRLIYYSLPHNRTAKNIWEKNKTELLKIIHRYVINGIDMKADEESDLINEIVSFAYCGEKDDYILLELARGLYDCIIADKNYYRKSIYHTLAHSIAKLNPALFLDAFLPDGTKLDYKVEHVLYNGIVGRYCLQDSDAKAVLDWACQNFEERLEKVARIINIVEYIDGCIRITDLAQAIIDLKHVSERILNALMHNFKPRSYCGSYSEILKYRLVAIEPLQSHENEIVRQWALTTIKEMDAYILHLQKQEQEEDHRSSTSFEP